jgi:hypothetical protein
VPKLMGQMRERGHKRTTFSACTQLYERIGVAATSSSWMPLAIEDRIARVKSACWKRSVQEVVRAARFVTASTQARKGGYPITVMGL